MSFRQSPLPALQRTDSKLRDSSKATLTTAECSKFLNKKDDNAKANCENFLTECFQGLQRIAIYQDKSDLSATLFNEFLTFFDKEQLSLNLTLRQSYLEQCNKLFEKSSPETDLIKQTLIKAIDKLCFGPFIHYLATEELPQSKDTNEKREAVKRIFHFFVTFLEPIKQEETKQQETKETKQEETKEEKKDIDFLSTLIELSVRVSLAEDNSDRLNPISYAKYEARLKCLIEIDQTTKDRYCSKITEAFKLFREKLNENLGSFITEGLKNKKEARELVSDAFGKFYQTPEGRDIFIQQLHFNILANAPAIISHPDQNYAAQLLIEAMLFQIEAKESWALGKFGYSKITFKRNDQDVTVKVPNHVAEIYKLGTNKESYAASIRYNQIVDKFKIAQQPYTSFLWLNKRNPETQQFYDNFAKLPIIPVVLIKQPLRKNLINSNH